MTIEGKSRQPDVSEMPHFVQRLWQKMEDRVNKAGTPEWINRNYIFALVEAVELKKTVIREDLGTVGELSNVTIDCEGRIFHKRWAHKRYIDTRAKIFGRLQKGRDYYKNPPKTRQIEEARKIYIPAGIDKALRRSQEIQQKNSEETKRMNETVPFLDEFMSKVMVLTRFRSLDPKEFQENVGTFLEEHKFGNPYQTDKKRIVLMLRRGITVKGDRKNYLAAILRALSCYFSTSKRLLYDLPAIDEQYRIDTSFLSEERFLNRQSLQTAVEKMNDILNPRPSTTVWLQRQQLKYSPKGISEALLRDVTARPYLLVAWKAVENFGEVDLPKGTLGEKMQERRARRGIPTYKDYLKEGKIEKAKEMIRQSRDMLQKLLDKTADYQTVKPSKD